MRHQHSMLRRLGWRTLVAAVALVACLMMPVGYRVGLSSSHAHAFFETWLDRAGSAPLGWVDAEADRAAGQVPRPAAGEVWRPVALSAAMVSRPASSVEGAAAFAVCLATTTMVVVARPPLVASSPARLNGLAVRPALPPPRPSTVPE